MKNRLFDLLFPPRCVLCHAGLTGSGCLCPQCAQEVRERYRVDGGRLVEGCTDSAAALLYLDKVRRVLISCKYHDKPGLGQWGGGLVAACLLRRMPDWQPDLITYTPTTLGHWWKRGFNLAHVLAKHAAARTGLPCVRTLRRSWFGKSQLRMKDVAARRRNADRTYAPIRSLDLTGKRVVLVDDVLATGSTAASCVAMLRQMGASEVFFLCLSQTPTSAKKVTKNGGKRLAES